MNAGIQPLRGPGPICSRHAPINKADWLYVFLDPDTRTQASRSDVVGGEEHRCSGAVA
jgi:hypothetical protein